MRESQFCFVFKGFLLQLNKKLFFATISGVVLLLLQLKPKNKSVHERQVSQELTH